MTRMVTQAALYGATMLSALLVLIVLGSQFDIFPDAGRLVMLSLMLFASLVASVFGLSLGDGAVIARFPSTTIGWLIGIGGIITVFFLFGLVLSYVFDHLNRFWRKQ